MMYSLAPALRARAIWATSFSVVQNTTFGPSPPGRRRNALRKSYPSITGMFQSSSTASGNALRHCSSACCPSSASLILKSRPSRMRRATFRMTLESSTTKQVFMVPPPFEHRSLHRPLPSLHPMLGRQRLRRRIQPRVHVENDHQLPIEPMHTGRHAREPPLEI